MGAFIDITGNKYGKLTVLERIPNTNPIKWLCRCDCGNLTKVTGNNLKSGNTTSCGCADTIHKLSKAKDFTGQRFGKLVCIERIGYRYQPCGRRHILWKCQCDCGKTTVIDVSHLAVGDVSSCGCFKVENAKRLYTRDLTNMRFGRLTVLCQDETKTNGVWWVCRCDCGWTTTVRAQSLTRGLTTSCGCLKMSRGERFVNAVLKQIGLRYKREYMFRDLFTEKGNPLRFDFALFAENGALKGLIEYQGEQHYRSINGTNFGKQQREKTDKQKRIYCKQRNIHLVEIPYYEHAEFATLRALVELYANPVPSSV